MEIETEGNGGGYGDRMIEMEMGTERNGDGS